MGTDIHPEPPAPVEGGQAEGAPPAGPPQPPVAASPEAAGPAAPVVAATGAPPPQYTQDQLDAAMGLHRALNDPIGAGEAMTRLVQRHGQLPEWFTWDHAVDAMRNYAQFMAEMESDDEGAGVPASGGPPVPQGATQMPDFESALQRAVAPLQAEIASLRQDRQADEGTRRAETITTAVETVGVGLDPAARETLLNNVVYGLRSAMDQGAQVDFSPRAIQGYAESMLTHLRSLSLTQQQEEIEEHRRLAPQTRVPNGAPTGAPVPRGLAGSASRALELARQWEAGQVR